MAIENIQEQAPAPTPSYVPPILLTPQTTNIGNELGSCYNICRPMVVRFE